MSRKPRKFDSGHVVLNTATSQMECRHCWTAIPFPLPIDLRYIAKAVDPFIEAHRYCEPRETRAAAVPTPTMALEID